MIFHHIALTFFVQKNFPCSWLDLWFKITYFDLMDLTVAIQKTIAFSHDVGTHMWVLCNFNNQNQINNMSNFFVQHLYSTFINVLTGPIHSNLLNQTLALVFLVIWSCTTQHHHYEHHPHLWANKTMVVLILVIFRKLK